MTKPKWSEDVTSAPPVDDDVEPGVIVLLAEPEDHNQRVDHVLARHSARLGLGLSRTRLQALLDEGCVRMDGAPAQSSRAKVRSGSTLVLSVPEPAAATPMPEAIPLRIVFEDDQLLVVDKPAGLVVHPAAGHLSGTLVNALVAHCGSTLSGIGGVRRPGIVHRLDKDTSGLIVVAKTDRAHAGLSAIFADHGRSGSLVREYLAFVWNVPAPPAGVIDAPLGRHPGHRDRMAVVRAGGRRALTRYQTEAEFAGLAARIRCRLETGRTHQIRVHMTHLGHPLIGDPVYATGFRTKALQFDEPGRTAIEGLHRQALHAAVLGFDHPISGTTLRFESPLPPDLQDLEHVLATARVPGAP